MMVREGKYKTILVLRKTTSLCIWDGGKVQGILEILT